MIDLRQGDSLEYLKTFKDYEFDVNYSDPPYALGSEVIIRPDGKVDYKKANDFMNKWEMPTGTYWEQWFKEAYRTLKHGGYLIMFGMDRQLLLFKYYANLAGFTEQQSLYWYFISNFPKATDLSKQIDKNAGAERNIIEVKGNKNNEVLGITKGVMADNNAITELAKKYNGYKYSIAPLKQTNETIMVFKKPNKTGSVLHDVLAKENGDETISGNCIDIDGNRVETSEEIKTTTMSNFSEIGKANKKIGAGGGRMGFNFHNEEISRLQYEQKDGRYPSQTFCDSDTAEVLGECSKILHKCDFEENEHEQYLQLYQKYAIMKEKHKGDELWENANIVETPLQTKEKELGSVQEVVQQNNLQKTETKNLQNYLSVFNAEWNLWITKQTEQEKIISALNDVLHNLDLEKINQNVLYAVKNVINTPIDTVLKVAKTLITGIMESLENDQHLQLGREAKYMEDLIIDKVDFVIPMLSVLFVTTKPEIDTIQIMTFLKKYIMFVKVAIQKYIEETSSCHDQTQYQANNYDIYFYKSKVSKSERNAGCDELPIKDRVFNGTSDTSSQDIKDVEARFTTSPSSNNHPTLKPIKLNERILKLFKTPNEQKIIYPFAGSGSEIIGGVKAGFTNWVGCEINPDYVEIAKARIDYWSNKFDDGLDEIVVEKKIDESQVSLFDLMED